MQSIKEESAEVYYANSSVVKVDSKTIQWLKDKALHNKNKKSRLCVHKSSADDAVHEMLIVHARDVYVPPHKHINKTESFHIIEGSVDIVIFSESGHVTEVIPLGKDSPEVNFYYRISDPLYHTLLITSDIVVFHETTKGPFKKEDTIYAPWAPNGLNPEANRKYIQDLKESVRRFRS